MYHSRLSRGQHTTQRGRLAGRSTQTQTGRSGSRLGTPQGTPTPRTARLAGTRLTAAHDLQRAQLTAATGVRHSGPCCAHQRTALNPHGLPSSGPCNARPRERTPAERVLRHVGRHHLLQPLAAVLLNKDADVQMRTRRRRTCAAPRPRRRRKSAPMRARRCAPRTPRCDSSGSTRSPAKSNDLELRTDICAEHCSV